MVCPVFVSRPAQKSNNISKVVKANMVEFTFTCYYGSNTRLLFVQYATF